MQGAAVRASEDQVPVCPARAGGQPLGGLAPVVGAQDRDGAGIEGELAGASGRLEQEGVCRWRLSSVTGVGVVTDEGISSLSPTKWGYARLL
jgi:hypothetical protein